ncbi:MAG: hypothetical protein ABII22_05420 [Candidatus Micrarchaeota archaeon]
MQKSAGIKMCGKYKEPVQEIKSFEDQLEQTLSGVTKPKIELPKGIAIEKSAQAERRVENFKDGLAEGVVRAKQMLEKQLGARIQQSLGQTEARLAKSKGEDTERYQQTKSVFESASHNMQQGKLEQTAQLAKEGMVFLALADRIAENRVKKEAPKVQEYLKASWDMAILHDLSSAANYANAAVTYSKLNPEDKQKLDKALHLQINSDVSGLLISILAKKAENYASKTSQDFDRPFEYASRGYFEESQKAYDFANLRAGIKRPAKIAQEEQVAKAYFSLVDGAVKTGKTVQEYSQAKGTNLQEMESGFTEANRKIKTAAFEQELSCFQGGVYAQHTMKAKAHYKEYLAEGNRLNEACAYAYLDALTSMKGALAAKAGKAIPNIEAAFAKIEEAALTNKPGVLNDAYLELRHSGIALHEKKTEAAIMRNIQLMGQQNQKLGQELRVTDGKQLVYDAATFQRRLEHALGDLRAGKTGEAVRELKDIASDMSKKEGLARRLKSVDALEQNVDSIYQYYEGVMRVSKSLTGVPGLRDVGASITLQMRDARMWLSKDFTALRQEMLAGRTGKIPAELQDSLGRVGRGELPRDIFNNYAEGIARQGKIKSGDLAFLKRVAEVQEAQFEIKKKQGYIETATYAMREYAKLQAIISKTKEERSGDMGMGVRIGNLQSAAKRFLEIAQTATREMKEGGEFNSAKYVAMQGKAIEMEYHSFSDFAHRGNERHEIWERIIAFEKGVFAAKASGNLSTNDPEARKKMDQGMRLAQQQVDAIISSTISLKSITTTGAQAEMFDAANPILMAYMSAVNHAVNGRNTEARSLLQQGLVKTSAYESAYSSAYTTQIWTDFSIETGVNIAAIVNPEFAIAYQIGNLLEAYNATGKLDYVNLAFAAGAMILKATPALTQAEGLVGKIATMQKVARGIELGAAASMTVGGIAVAGYEMKDTGLTYESGANFASNVIDALVGGAHGAIRLRHALKYKKSWLTEGMDVKEAFGKLQERTAKGFDTVKVKLREFNLDETGAVGSGVAELSARNVARKAFQQLDRVSSEVQQRLQKGDVRGALKVYDDAMLTARAAYNRTKNPHFQDEFAILKRERDELAGKTPGTKKPELKLVSPQEMEHGREQIPEKGQFLNANLIGKEKGMIEKRIGSARELVAQGNNVEALQAYDHAIRFTEAAYRSTGKEEYVTVWRSLLREKEDFVRRTGVQEPRLGKEQLEREIRILDERRREIPIQPVQNNPEHYARQMPALKIPDRLDLGGISDKTVSNITRTHNVTEQQVMASVEAYRSRVRQKIGQFPEAFQPRETVDVGGQKIMIGSPLILKKDVAIPLFIQNPEGGAKLVMAYRSESQGVWRRFAGEMAGSYSKGNSEHLQDIDWRLQKKLDEVFSDNSRHVDARDRHLIEFGPSVQMAVATGNKVLPTVEMDMVFTKEDGIQKSMQEGAQTLELGKKENLPAKILDSWRTNEPSLGNKDVYGDHVTIAMQSENGKYVYLIAATKDGMFIKSISDKETGVNVGGSSTKGVLLETEGQWVHTPIVEYSDQLAKTKEAKLTKMFGSETMAGGRGDRVRVLGMHESSKSPFVQVNESLKPVFSLLKDGKIDDALASVEEMKTGRTAAKPQDIYLKGTIDEARLRLKENPMDALMKYDEAIDLAEEAGKKELKRTLETERRELLVDMMAKGIAPDQVFGTPKAKEKSATVEAKVEKPKTQAEKLRAMAERLRIMEEEAKKRRRAEETTDVPAARQLKKEQRMLETAKILDESRTKALQGGKYEELSSRLGSYSATTLIRAIVSSDITAVIRKGDRISPVTRKDIQDFEQMNPKRRAERVGEVLNRMYDDTPNTISARHSKETKVAPDSPRRQAFAIVKDIETKLGMKLVDENAVLLHEPNILRVDINGEIHQRARKKIEDVKQSPLYSVFDDKLKENIRDPRLRDPALKFVDYRVLAVLSDHRAIGLAVKGAAAEFGTPKVKSISQVSYLGAGCFNVAFQIDVTFVDGTKGTFVLRGPSDPRADYSAYELMKAGRTNVPASSKAYEATDMEGRKIQISIQEFVKGDNIGNAIGKISQKLPDQTRQEDIERVTASYFDNMATALFYGLVDNHDGNFIVNPDLSITRMDYGLHSLQTLNAGTINQMASQFTQTLLPEWSGGMFIFDNKLKKVAFEAFKKKWETLQQRRGNVRQKMQELIDAGQLFSGNGENHDAVDFYADGKVKRERGLEVLGRTAIKQFDEFTVKSAEDAYSDFTSTENSYIQKLNEEAKKRQANPPQPQQAHMSQKTLGDRPGKI